MITSERHCQRKCQPLRFVFMVAFAAILAGFFGGPAVTLADELIVSKPVEPYRAEPPPPGALVPAGPAPTYPEGEPLMVGPITTSNPIDDGITQVGGEEGLFEVAPPDALSAPDVNQPGVTANANPPDTVHDVGPNHVVQMTNNTGFIVFDKRGNPIGGATPNAAIRSLTALWPVGDICRTLDTDPIVVYDHLADRWLMAQVIRASLGGPAVCMAVSQTPDPTGAWFAYTYDNMVLTTFPDYEKFGVWPDGYYMSSHEGPHGIFVFDRANMLAGAAAGFMKRTIANVIPSAGRSARILPADLDGSEPPAGTPNFFVRTIDDQQDSGATACPPFPVPVDCIEVYEAVTDWLTPSFAVNLVNVLTPAPFQIMVCNRSGGGARDCIPQPNTANSVDALSNRPMMQLKYRNFGTYASMVFNQTIDVSGSINALLGFMPANEVAGIRWYELQKSGANWTIQQQGTYAPQPIGATTEAELLHRWMGSIAIDKLGGIALGYSIVNDDNTNPLPPSISYTGRRIDDVLGLLPQTEQSILVGTNTQAGVGARWGDYSAMTVDPVDDCTFWYTQHVAAGAGGRPTQIASFRFDNCPAGADLEIEKSAHSDLVFAGEELFYEITVTNNGPIDATNVVVTDTLPAGVTFLTDTDSCTEAPAGTLTCELGDLADGVSASFTIKVAVDADLVVSLPNGSTTITNTAVVTADQVDVNELNNEATVITIVEDRADLQLSKVCKPDRPLLSGETATCTLFVDNLGFSYARGVQLTDTYLSDGIFSFGAITPSQGSCSAPSDGVVECDLGNLAVQTPPDSGRATVEIEFTALRNMDINDLAVVNSSTFDPDYANNLARGFVAVVEPDINVIMEENGEFGDLCEDDQKDLILTVRNQGTGDLIITDITSDNPNNFNIVPTLQYPLVIMPGEELDIPIRFDPDPIEDCSDTAPRTAEITITSNDPDGPNITAVMGKVLCPNLVLDPPDLTGLFAFPPTVTDAGDVLGCFEDQTMTISNDGFCPLKINDITATPPFAVIDPTVFPIVLQPNVDQLIVTVRFAPIAGGPVDVPDETTGTLQVASNDPDPADTMADLCGEAIGEKAGLRVLGVDKTSGLPVDELTKIKLKLGSNLIVKETNVPLKDTLICGNTVLYHFHREQLLPKTYKVIADKYIGEHPYGGSIILRGKKRIPLETCQFEELVLKMKRIDP